MPKEMEDRLDKVEKEHKEMQDEVRSKLAKIKVDIASSLLYLMNSDALVKLSLTFLWLNSLTILEILYTHKTRLHIGQLVKDTSAKLKQASETDHRAGVSASKKVTDAKLAKDFQVVLKEFQKAQRLAVEREISYTPSVPQEVHPSRLLHVILMLNASSYYIQLHGEVDLSSDKSAEQRSLVESRRQEVLLLDDEIAFNEAIIDEREQGIQEIQKQIGEVNKIFKDLAVLVHEQGIMIDDIGTHIENSQATTLQAKS
ncbi:Syntaxin-22 [Hibiscus syriacus]|uniref:Syntaxin-22 n=1 Tax=Hibiscus syriacus TaxID=106335 RepID=A0A6A3CRV4_HIBSY|nr:Syntaxin-22 [Hibiscus syriacus]